MNATPRPLRQRGVPVIVEYKLLDLGIAARLSHGLAYHAPRYCLSVLTREHSSTHVLHYPTPFFLRVYLVEDCSRAICQRSHLLDPGLKSPALGHDDSTSSVNHPFSQS